MSSLHIEQLESLLRQNDTRRSEFKSALLRVSAEMKERIADGAPTSTPFFADALRALSQFRGIAHAVLRMTCLFDAALFLNTHGYATHALDAYQQLHALALRTGEKHWIRRAHMVGGVVNADLGNVADAVICYSDALSIAKELGEGELSVLVNLGTALNYAGLYKEAIPCLNRAVALARTDSLIRNWVDQRIPIRTLECAALNNLAQSYLSLEDFDQGYAAITECLSKSPRPTDAVMLNSLTIRESTAMQLALRLGELELAKKHDANCQRYAVKSGRRAQFISQVAHGLCEVYCGDVDNGLSLLESALHSEIDADSLRIDAISALVQACDQAGRSEEALGYLSKLLNLLKTRQARGIAALVSTSLGSNGQLNLRASSEGLRALALKQAELRAKVAENRAVSSRIEMLERLAVAADAKEESSGEHGYRVGSLAGMIAGTLGWARDQCFAIELAARLHDIGKIWVPDRILLNSQRLKETDRHFITIHTITGAELLAKGDIPQLRMAEQIARSHHEWWNGEGYPSKLKGKRIPIHARIVALADVFDALTHGRPYAEAWSTDRALEEIRNRRGTQFDPDLTDLFVELIERLRNQHVDLDAYLGKASRDSPFLQARNKIRLMLASEREHEQAAAVSGNATRH